MPRFVLEEQEERKSFDLLEEDSIHEATVGHIEVTTWPASDSEPERKSLNWTFVLNTAGDWDGKKIWGNTSMVFNTNTNCKLRNWAQVLLGEELAANFELDTDDLVGRKCRILTGHRDGKDKEGNPRKKQFVADVLPPRRSSSAYLDDPGF